MPYPYDANHNRKAHIVAPLPPNPGGKRQREREKKKATRQRSRAIPANQRASDRQNALGKKQLHLHEDDVYEGFPRKGQTQAVTIDTEDAYQGPVQAANGHALAVMKSP